MGGGTEGPKKGDDLPSDPNPRDGYPPEFDQKPEKRDIDTSSYGTTRESGVDVPLAPIKDVYYWYARGEARFVDARSEASYRDSHVYGAVLSPAPSGFPDGDPVVDWPTGDRIVAYCACPHHLSSMRASTLIDEGYENVFVIDEGYREWYANNYPIAGAGSNSLPQLQVIEGRTDPAFAGEKAWARHRESGQREVTNIAEDGSYELHLTFADVTHTSPIAVETPAYTVEAPLGELTADLVTGD
jgi:rhodanese-related sulfurtransferase